MGLGDFVLLAGAALGAMVLFHPALMRRTFWRATVTPLASIIGSGFLVSGPILAHTSGRSAWLAMLGLCAVGYLYGSVIRHNIINIEPELERLLDKRARQPVPVKPQKAGYGSGSAKTAKPRARRPAGYVFFIERFSDLALVLAYFISVAFYLTLFAAFALRIGNIVDSFWIKLLTTLVLAALGLLGFFRGLRALERVEEYSVGFKLSIIFGLIAALFAVSVAAFAAGRFSWPELTHQGDWLEARILLGLVILVQGFETSRYLGRAYDAQTRVKSMRVAQLISTAIYLVFIVLATRYFTGSLPKSGGETAIIDLLRPVGFLVAPLLILAAMASQLSAAVADMNGSAGLLAEVSEERFNPRWGYGLAAIAAIGIVWTADIFAIITFASKAFLLYYGLQSIQAVLAIASGRSRAKKWRGFVYGAAAVLALMVIILAVPAGV